MTNGGTVLNKNKKNLKGFTLIELIIVLAIFSVIMVLVMSFIDPVSKVMTSTSVRERTASYVDNIGEYVDKSIRHSQFIRIYENEYKDGAVPVSEEQALSNFIDDFYDGAVTDKFQPLTGKVHVLKLVNSDITVDLDGTNTFDAKAGRVYESVYDFEAGDSLSMIRIPDIDPITHDPIEGTNRAKYWGNRTVSVMAGDFVNGAYVSVPGIATLSFPHSSVTPISGSANVSVINEEHFRDYSYYYQLGLYDFNGVPDSELGDYEHEGAVMEPDRNAKFYYSQLVERTKDGTDPLQFKPSERQFSLNVVSYQTKNGEKGMYRANHGTGPEARLATLFKSPANMSTVSMTFQNVINAKEADSNSKRATYYQVEQVTLEEVAPKPESGKGIVKDGVVNMVPISYTSTPFSYFPADDGAEIDVVYIIYTLPDEIFDSETNYENVIAGT